MFRGRGALVFLVLVLIGLAVYLLIFRLPGGLPLLGSAGTALPEYLRDIVPADWQVIEGKQKQCNFDDDPELEWLVFYRYDVTDVTQPNRPQGTNVSRSPIGAAVFDAQTAVPDAPGNPSSYRPNLLIPYRLLPDFYTGKGQGYLGESDIEPFYHTVGAAGTACRVDEIGVFGFSNGDLPTRLSLFRWQGRTAGYGVAHFVGDAHVAATVPSGGTDLVSQVTTYDRIDNHRSLLCESRTYVRWGADAALAFREESSAYTLDFCFEAPPDPIYPEGVVVALLRGRSPGPRFDGAALPPTTSFALNNAELAFDVVNAAAGGVPIVSVTNPAGVAPDPAGGTPCDEEAIGPAATQEPKWLCGRERVEVETEIVLDGRVRRAVWRLVSLLADRVDSDVHWRVEALTLAQ